MPAARRILVVAPQPFYSDRGTPIATRHLLQALSELDYEADVLTYPLGRAADIPGVRLIRTTDPLGLRSVPIGFSLRKCWLDLFLFSGLQRCLAETRYLCTVAVEEAAFVAAVVAPRFRVPVVYDMQSSLAEQMTRLPAFRSRLAGRVFARSERWLFDRVDYIMTSAGLADRVKRANPLARVREWQYPAISTAASSAQVEQLRQELGIDEGAPVILYAGSFQRYQGLARLLDAMPAVLERVPSAVLILVGAGHGPEDRELRRHARRVPARALRVLERRSRELMPGFLSLAQVVVSPRAYGENLPLKILEYLAAGRAIVATSIPAHLTVLDADRAVLVEPCADDLAQGMIRLLLDEEHRGTLERNARAYADERLDWLGFVNSVGEVLNEVSGDGHPG